MKGFHIKTRDGAVQVDEDVYKAYYKHKWNEEYRNKKCIEKELPYEDLRDSGVPIELIMMDASRTLEDEVISRIMVQKLRKCMSGLSSYEHFLIMFKLFQYTIQAGSKSGVVLLNCHNPQWV